METSVKPHYERIWLIDELRGFAVICMIFYHAFYTLSAFFSSAFAQKLFLFFMPVEPIFAGLFILISGISSCLSRSNLKRGFKLFAIAIVVTIVTSLLNSIIVFGILHFLSVSMIIFGLCQKSFQKISFWPGIGFCVFLFLCTMQISSGTLAFFIKLPPVLYTSNWLCPIGIYSSDFFSADYFPLLPWFFLFLIGTFWGRFAAQGKFPRFFYKKRVPFLCWFGQHALLVYIIHQPIIYLISQLFVWIF